MTKTRARPRPKKVKPKVRRRRPGWIRRSAVRAGKMSVATWKFGRWAYDGYAKRRATRADGRTASAAPPTVAGNAHRPNRKPSGPSFMPKRHDKRRWYSRNIHYGADGSVTTTPTVAYTWWGRLLAALFDQGRDRWVRAAQRRADNVERLGKPRDRVERMERKIVLKRERRAGRGKFTCEECPAPLNQFRTAAELNAHFRARHLDDDDAGRATGEGRPRGMPQQSQPRHRAQPGRHRPTGPNMPGAPTRPRVYLVDPHQNGDPKAAAWGPNIDKIKGAVVANGTGIANSLQQWGEYVPDGVGSLREDFAELETMASALEEAIQQKIQNLAQGAGPLNGRPISEEVLAKLRPIADAAQQIATAGAQSLSAFEEEYAQDIARAKAADRPEEDWLAAGA